MVEDIVNNLKNSQWRIQPGIKFFHIINLSDHLMPYNAISNAICHIKFLRKLISISCGLFVNADCIDPFAKLNL